jgi:hypothetical protein
VADRPIFEIEIEDGEFKQFAARLESYKTAVAQLPQAWAASAGETDALREHMERMSALLNQQNELMQTLGKHTEMTSESALSTGAAWATMYFSSRRFVKNIHDSTMSLNKWLKLSAVFSGLLGAGGLFGISRMATGVSHSRAEAAGVGLSVGDKASFDLAFGRLGNSEGLLRGFHSALHDVTNPALYSLGVAGKVRGMSAADAFAESLPYIKKLVDHTDPAQLGNVIKARQLDRLGIDVHTASVIKGMKPEEIAQMQRDFWEKKGPLGLPDDMARKWTDFSTQMHRAWLTIETVLGRNLVNITPGLVKLSDEMVRLFRTLTKDGGLLNGLFHSVNDGMEGVANTILSGAFQASVVKFAHSFDLTKKDFEALNDWFSFHESYIKGAAAVLAGLWAGGKVAGALGALGVGAGAAAAGVVGGAALGAGRLNGNESELNRQRLAATPGAVSLGNGTWSVPQQSGGRQVVKENEAQGPYEQTSGGMGAHGQRLTQLSTASGRHVTVNADHAENFAGFIRELEVRGYPIKDISGYNDRANRNNPSKLSEHAYGNAIDINPSENPNSARLKTNFPPDVADMAHRHGLKWGGEFHHMKDTMHFEYNAGYDRAAKQRSIFGHPSHAGQRGAARVEVIDNSGGSVQVAH